ncbi:hypothetical protein V7S43_009929 [Phytophthora oleae]|uniref:Uncharacterized protein n=1 Tax=Phytophthora oleae TaxID=2107226 RepID=A0ABD3FFW8_9STRA
MEKDTSKYWWSVVLGNAVYGGHREIVEYLVGLTCFVGISIKLWTSLHCSETKISLDLIYPACERAATVKGFSDVVSLLIVNTRKNAVKYLFTRGEIMVDDCFERPDTIGNTAMMKMFLDTGCVSQAAIDQVFERAVTVQSTKKVKILLEVFVKSCKEADA